MQPSGDREICPLQVEHYKGLNDHAVYAPHSEYAALNDGHYTSLYNATTVSLVQQRLDLKLEAALGYQYGFVVADRTEAKSNPVLARKARMW